MLRLRLRHHCCLLGLPLLIAIIILAGNSIFRAASRKNLLALAGDKKLLTFRRTERWGIGNEMFALASTIGIARNYPAGTWLVCADGRSAVRTAFPSVEHFPKCDPEDVLDSMDGTFYREKAYARYDADTLSLPIDHHLVLDRFLQSWKYFKHVESDLRQLFRFADAVTRAARAALADAIERHLQCTACIDDVETIGFHVRRFGLSASHLRGKGYVTADARYLHRAMQYFERRLAPNDNGPVKVHVFVVVSDDIAWCREHFHGTDVVYVDTGQDLVDMAVLASCRHSVITVGTFGWWTAWLVNGTTVYYKDWPLEDSSLYKATSHEDYFPPEWIGL